MRHLDDAGPVGFGFGMERYTVEDGDDGRSARRPVDPRRWALVRLLVGGGYAVLGVWLVFAPPFRRSGELRISSGVWAVCGLILVAIGVAFVIAAG